MRRRLIDGPRGLGQPVPAEVFDRDYAAGRWDLLFADEETPRNRTVADLIAGVAPQPTVLDVGCGSGRLAQLLTPVRPARYLGMDLSAQLCNARKRLGWRAASSSARFRDMAAQRAL